ncbi:5-deoxy-glucuronate isomerase [Nocardia salmonicida]|uniref:5-deoxy-glucuronate isomerase n=1 Tax=Nocardia salmonicida TaxID=53431 RepID=UPI0007A3B0BC|nr:5-deoxy-glucuronate isomerase [Nocardia salmonicida]MBC7299769.1 5-deoxy-glucuronate isomerase [Nocardia sp.]
MTTALARTPNGLTLTRHLLTAGEHLAVEDRPDQETALILIAGHITTRTGDDTHIAERADPFTAPAVGWYFPASTAASVTAGPDGADLIQVHAPLGDIRTTGPASPVTAVTPETRGHRSWEREVTTLLAPPRTGGLLLGETIARDGRWSTYPPHRHSISDPPRETALQEAFAFRVRPATGFGVLLTYDDTVADACSTVVLDTSIATVTHGYHAIAAAGGHDLYYLWAAHGDTDHHFALHTDPAHAWLLDT